MSRDVHVKHFPVTEAQFKQLPFTANHSELHSVQYSSFDLHVLQFGISEHSIQSFLSLGFGYHPSLHSEHSPVIPLHCPLKHLSSHGIHEFSDK